MDGGVGGSWEEVEYIEVGGQNYRLNKTCPKSDSKPFIPDLMTKVDTEKYLEFVKEVTSAPSLDYAAILAARLSELEVNDCNVTQLMTAALGLCAESGEFTEVVKKIFLQGKPYNEENVFPYET